MCWGTVNLPHWGIILQGLWEDTAPAGCEQGPHDGNRQKDVANELAGINLLLLASKNMSSSQGRQKGAGTTGSSVQRHGSLRSGFPTEKRSPVGWGMTISG